MAKLFDTHAHYYDEKLSDNPELIDILFKNDICGILCAAENSETSRKCIALAEKYESMYAAAGIHPHNCGKIADIGAAMNEIADLAKHPKVKAIGEIGLDYYYDFSDKVSQMKFFRAQMELAEKLRLPVIIHDRNAHGDTFSVISDYPNVRGILHSYSGSAEMVREYVKRGWYISFSGVITFKNASKILEAITAVPDDKILVETDCPYLAPVPMRGKVNHSGYLSYTARKAAEIRGMDYEDFCRMTTENAKRIFGIE